MQNLSSKTVREIALEMPVATKVFEEYKIDYCCGGKKSFLDACRSASANPEIVLEKIDNLLKITEKTELDRLNDLNLTELIKYICDKHHVFTREEMVNLSQLMSKVVIRHGENHPELLEMNQIFAELCHDLSAHMLKEEQILFPYIEKLEKSFSNETAVPFSCFGTVQNPVRMMMMEHDTAGDLLKKMREISQDYALPQGACLSYTALFNRLAGFELDLHQHIHLENNLLFPRAIELEQKVFSDL